MDKISRILPPSPRTMIVQAQNLAKEEAKAKALQVVNTPPSVIEDRFSASEELLNRQMDTQKTFPTYAGELSKKKLVQDIQRKFFAETAPTVAATPQATAEVSSEATTAIA